MRECTEQMQEWDKEDMVRCPRHGTLLRESCPSNHRSHFRCPDCKMCYLSGSGDQIHGGARSCRSRVR